MPTLEPSVRKIEDPKAAPSTHPFETVRTEHNSYAEREKETDEEIHGEQTTALVLVGLMILIIVATGVLLWLRVNS
jgi:hypothetical protein